MKYSRLFALTFVLFLAIAATAGAASTTPSLPSTGATPAPGAGGGATTLTVVAAIVGLLVIVGIAVKMFDLKRKRDAEAVHLQAQLSDALLREGSLDGLAITPTAHVPLWSGGPATVELSGRARSPESRRAALQLVEREAARIRPDVRVVDRIERAA